MSGVSYDEVLKGSACLNTYRNMFKYICMHAYLMCLLKENVPERLKSRYNCGPCGCFRLLGDYLL